MSTSAGGLTSTTAPGKTFGSRQELAEHYKSDWHKYNLKRREAGLPLLREDDFQARLEAALALKREREGREERTGKDHLKNKDKRKHKKKEGVTIKSQAPAYERIKKEDSIHDSTEESNKEEEQVKDEVKDGEEMKGEEEPPVIEPRQSLFDKHISSSVKANLERMQRKYGFFIPDQEYLVDAEGLVGYCQEKIKLGHYCLYCQRIFSTWQGCQKHMIATRHTKLRYERGVDMEEFDPFYDFSEANREFMGAAAASEEAAVLMEEDGDEGWEDITDDEDEEMDEPDEDVEEEDEGLYAGYEDEIAKLGYDVTSLGELVFPDGRIVGHRGLARYYKQRITPTQDRAAVVTARRAAGERVYNGRVYNVNQHSTKTSETNALALARAGLAAGAASSGQGKGVLVPSSAGGFSAVSLYRYRAVVKKARRDDARGQRLQNRTKQNINRMDKKANRLMNNVSVAHAQR